MKHSDERKSHNGQRKPRGSRDKKRFHELGYYCIVTDTKETEKNYLNGLKASLPDRIKDRLTIKVLSASTKDLVEEAQKQEALNPQYAQTWIVFDRDKVTDFDKIIMDAKQKGISVGWSNPCIEIWFHAYYGEMPRFSGAQAFSKQCCSSFKRVYKQKTKHEYEKAEDKIYQRLKETGNEEDAIGLAELRYNEWKEAGINKPSLMESTTTLHNLIKEIRERTDHT